MVALMVSSSASFAETKIAWRSKDVIETRMLGYKYEGGEKYKNPKDGSNYATRTLKRLGNAPRLCDRVLKRKGELSGTITGAPKGADKGKVWLEDNYGRVLDQKDVKAPGFDFSLSSARSLKTGIYLKAELTSDGKQVWSGQTDIRMEFPKEDPWREFMLGVYNMGTKPGTGELWRKMGLSHRALRTTNSPAFSIQNDLKYHASNILYSIVGLYHRDYKHWRELKAKRAQYKGPVINVRHKCLSDPETIEFMNIILTAAAQRFHPYPPLHYSIADEIGIGNMASPHDMCASKWCKHRFVEWLKKRYETLDKVNAHWDTKFDSWDKVEMFSNWQALERSKSGNYAPWADRLEFMDFVLYDYIAQGVKIIRKVDPDAMCNLSGVQQPSCWGFDHWLLARTVNCATPYEIGEGPDVLSSFYEDGKRGMIYAPGFGKDMEKLWLTFLRGYGISGQWDSFGKKTYSKMIDIEKKELTELGTKVKEFADWVSAGPGRLRNRSDRARDPVAILYSQPSLRANYALEVGMRPDVQNGGAKWIHRDSHSVRQREMSFRVRVSWVQWTHDIGIWPKFVDTRDLGDDFLSKKGFKILIVPRAAAMSDATAAAIKKFAESGGTVVADTWCGLMDETCKLRDKGVLDDLFGVTRGNYRKMALEKLAPGQTGIEIDGAKLPFTTFEQTLKADTGKAGGQYKGADVFITRNVGKGKTVYLNFRLESYFLHRLQGKRVAAARTFLLDLFKEGGVEPIFSVTEPKGAVPFHTVGHDVCLYTNGKGYLVGVRPNPTVMHSDVGGVESRYKNEKGNVFYKKHPGVLRGPADLWAYDVNKGKLLGKISAVPFTSDPESGLFFAFFPFEIKGLEAEANVTPDRTLQIKGTIKTSTPVMDEKLVIYLRVLRPDGSEQTAYKRSIDCEGSAFTHSVPLGLNEHGNWKVVLREPCSGLCVTKEITLP